MIRNSIKSHINEQIVTCFSLYDRIIKAMLSSAAQSAANKINSEVPSEARFGSIVTNEELVPGEARFGRLNALDLVTISSFSNMNYRNRDYNYMFAATMRGNWFKCPINVPFCERETCQVKYRPIS